MGSKQEIPHYTNLGGLVLRLNDPLLKHNEAQEANNVTFRQWGEINQRSGFSAQLSAPVVTDNIRVIHQHVERATNDKTRLLVRGQRITEVVGDAEVLLASDLVEAETLGASAQLFDDSVLCTGEDEARSYNTTVGLQIIDMQDFHPSWCLTFANYMVYGGDTNLPQRVVFSALGDAKNVDSNADFIDILDAGPKLTGAFTLFNSLWVVSVDTITKIDGSDFTASSPGFNANIRTVWRGDGSVNHQSITVAHDRAYFVGRYGVYSFDGRNVIEISETINPIFSTGVNRTVIEKSTSVHDIDNNLVILSVPSVNSTVPDLHLVYHYEAALKVWSTWTGYVVSYWYAMQEAGEFTIPWHGNTTGQIFRHNGEADDFFEIGVPTAIKCRYKTGWEHLNGPAKRFIPKHLMPIVRGTASDTFIVRVFTNYSGTELPGFPFVATIPVLGPIWGVAVWGQFIWGGPSSDYIVTIGIPATVARNYAVEFEHETLGERFTMVGWSTVVINKGLTDGTN